jgi:hypothetical protein
MGRTALLPLRRIFITHKNPPASVGFEPATEYPVGPVASTLTTRPPKAASCHPNAPLGSRGSSVGIVSDYGLDGRGSVPDRGTGFFL